MSQKFSRVTTVLGIEMKSPGGASKADQGITGERISGRLPICRRKQGVFLRCLSVHGSFVSVFVLLRAVSFPPNKSSHLRLEYNCLQSQMAMASHSFTPPTTMTRPFFVHTSFVKRFCPEESARKCRGGCGWRSVVDDMDFVLVGDLGLWGNRMVAYPR